MHSNAKAQRNAEEQSRNQKQKRANRGIRRKTIFALAQTICAAPRVGTCYRWCCAHTRAPRKKASRKGRNGKKQVNRWAIFFRPGGVRFIIAARAGTICGGGPWLSPNFSSLD